MSASTARRQSTVHDFSTLRLHPDGSRVAIHPTVRVDLRDSRIRNTGRDTRGNRVALDAAGLGAVPKRTVIREDDDDDSEDIEIRKTKPRMPLRRKRRRIDEDVEFLGDSRNSAHCTGDTAIVKNKESMDWPVPSSDLLKCVHYFASQYYAARGLLSDRSRMYRRELRQRKARVGAVQAADSGAEVDTDADDLFAEDDDDENASEEEDRCEKSILKGQERSEGEGSSTKSVPDMYKAFDGSALMTIGMLFQEHVSMLLRPNIPSGWEEEMEAAGLVPEDESAVLEDEEDAEMDKSDDEDISVESISSEKD
ncbi:hypothetical protein F5888DRAFT_1797836 [Russula emetica]|nr:hypothetical protein F5888DRAFT_1797836 [Russula emetica]